LPAYAKIVRDGIPELLERLNKHPVARRLADRPSHWGCGQADEEIAEFDAVEPRGRLGELADVLEVVCSARASEGASEDEINRRRTAKGRARGPFAEGWFLESATTDQNQWKQWSSPRPRTGPSLRLNQGQEKRWPKLKVKAGRRVNENL